jgi:predicted MPP superfamily phosphohydrolase
VRLRPLAAVAAAGLAWPFVEPHLPVLRRVSAPVLPPGWAPLRLLHLSDLHLLPRQRRRAAWVRGLAVLDVDLVVSTGDHLSSAEAVEPLVECLGALTAGGTPGVFVPGNNDYYSPVVPSPLGYLRGGIAPLRRTPDLPWSRTAELLQDAGWTDLTHRRTTLPVGGRPVVLTGTDDAHLRRDRYREVAGRVEGFAIGVTHTPQRRLLRAFEADGHALVLAGHTHGGQLRLPRAGPLVTNCDLPRWRARGLTAGEGGWVHVSAGLGTSPYAPVRVCCRPEATLLELVARG